MEYFRIFDLPVQLNVDKKLLRSRYLELSRRSHPDYFATATPEVQHEALDTSAKLNKALKTLSNREETIRYVLMEKGLMEVDEKYKLSNDFLMEMLEINEAVSELAFESDPAQRAQIEMQIKKVEDEIYEPVADIIEHYQEGVTTEKELLQVKEYYFRKKYLERLQHQLNVIS